MPAVHLADPVASAAATITNRLADLLVDGTEYGVYELPVPQRDEAGAVIVPPYVALQITPSPDVRFVSGSRRAISAVEVAARAVGPDAKTPILRKIAAEIDRRLEGFAPAAGPDGAVILDCLRQAPLYYPERAGDVTTRHVGGLYVLHIA